MDATLIAAAAPFCYAMSERMREQWQSRHDQAATSDQNLANWHMISAAIYAMLAMHTLSSITVARAYPSIAKIRVETAKPTLALLHTINFVGYLAMSQMPLLPGLTSQPIRHVLWAVSLPLCILFIGQCVGCDTVVTAKLMSLMIMTGSLGFFYVETLWRAAMLCCASGALHLAGLRRIQGMFERAAANSPPLEAACLRRFANFSVVHLSVYPIPRIALLSGVLSAEREELAFSALDFIFKVMLMNFADTLAGYMFLARAKSDDLEAALAQRDCDHETELEQMRRALQQQADEAQTTIADLIESRRSTIANLRANPELLTLIRSSSESGGSTPSPDPSVPSSLGFVRSPYSEPSSASGTSSADDGLGGASWVDLFSARWPRASKQVQMSWDDATPAQEALARAQDHLAALAARDPSESIRRRISGDGDSDTDSLSSLIAMSGLEHMRTVFERRSAALRGARAKLRLAGRVLRIARVLLAAGRERAAEQVALAHFDQRYDLPRALASTIQMFRIVEPEWHRAALAAARRIDRDLTFALAAQVAAT